jgi:phosphoglycolate phosphatase-like HAD superfamily hydrolase
MRRLVLWDIDDTLIETGGVGSEVFAEAFQAATGRRLGSMPDPTGLTEVQIFRRALVEHGIEDDGLFERFAEAQAAEYRARGGQLLTRGRVLPGVHVVLRAVSASADLVQSVLSGNTRMAAQAKLAVFRLGGYLDLEVGAGGDDDPVRANLVPVVWERVAEKYGIRFDAGSTVLVGDAPADVETGHAHGCRVLAVATGKSSAEELRAAGADQVLADLTNTPEVLAALRAAT